ncbi:MAG: guanylate kinase [Chloroflexi bacterium]|nr:guanylate kinase [Chloroflexota bacterium]
MRDAGPLLVVLTGPSGAGKDSILNLLKERGSPYHFTVTATTRAPRPGEQHGVDYYFVSRDEFESMVRDGELLEHAIVYGQEKGVPKAPIRAALAEGKDVIMRTDVQGARYIKSVVPGAVTIFVSGPSREELERRLRDRGADSPEQMEVRLRTAAEETDAAGEFDYTIVNDDLNRCAGAIETILEQERAREDRGPVDLGE